MEIYSAAIIIILVLFIPLSRGILCWLFKINQILKLLKEISNKLGDANESKS